MSFALHHSFMVCPLLIRKRLINTRSKYTNYSVPIKVGLEHFTPAYWKSGALFRALAFHRSILSFLTRA